MISHDTLFDFPCSWSFRQLEDEMNGECLADIETLADARYREDHETYVKARSQRNADEDERYQFTELQRKPLQRTRVIKTLDGLKPEKVF